MNLKMKKTLFSFATARGSKRVLATVVMTTMASANMLFAQSIKLTSTNQTTSDAWISSLSECVGTDISDELCTTNGTNETDASKILFLYNVGTNEFLSIGGYWGTHAAISTTPQSIFLEKSSKDGKYYLVNKVSGSGGSKYIGYNAGSSNYGVYMDQTQHDVTFEKSANYSDKNKTYRIKIDGQYESNAWLTVFPNSTDANNICNYTSPYEATNENYKYQEWKIITRAEYRKLFLATAATMKALVDATFLITCPDFRVNDTDAAKWNFKSSNDDFKSYLRFGDECMYKDYTNVSTTNWNKYDHNHQCQYGKDFYCYTKGQRDYTVYQDIKITRAGWYAVRCNGVSTANSAENIEANGEPIANLFAVVVDSEGNEVENTFYSTSLNTISEDDVYALAKEADGAGLGEAFANGKYENQVQMCFEKTADGNEISEDNPITVRIGFSVDKGTNTATETELTAVDDFRLLYAGMRKLPELLLDEDYTDMRYLTLSTDEYTNNVLHLKRTLNANMWNSLVLPVDLNYGQVKQTFGDAVKVAKLNCLTDNSIQFLTVEPETDDDVMISAFVPYIIFPPVTKVVSPEYTVEKFYTTTGEDNSAWLGTNYESSSDESNHLTMTIPANHYTITRVSFDRTKFKENVDTDTWISKTIVNGGDDERNLSCKGTMTKTYDDNGIINGRNDLNGDYFMYKGKLIQVPSGSNDSGQKYTYGLKGFRCWFELTNKTNDGKEKKMSLTIDGIEDSTTGISDIHTADNSSSYKKGMNGVFNMNGQNIRKDNSTEGLPKGMYIVNGKKVIIG